VVYRVFLFTAPWCALLIAELRSAPWRALVASVACVTALAAGMQGLYGPVEVDAFTPAEQAASVWLYAHAAPPAGLVERGQPGRGGGVDRLAWPRKRVRGVQPEHGRLRRLLRLPQGVHAAGERRQEQHRMAGRLPQRRRRHLLSSDQGLSGSLTAAWYPSARLDRAHQPQAS
jgi:hypothetical protein